jgi:hypothetical protein
LLGSGSIQDIPAALTLFKAAADQGNAEAQYHLGVMYFDGRGVESKHSTALQYFSLAANQGHTRSLFNLATMHLNGLGVLRNCQV